MSNLRIANLEIYTLKAGVETPFEWGDGCAYQRTACILRLDTEEALTGWGPGRVGASSWGSVAEALKEILVGQNPLDTGVLWERMNAARIPVEIKGCVDIALWDLKGKALEQPVHQLLGGAFRTCIPAYATGGYYPVSGDDEAWLEGCVRRAIKRGFRAYKMKVGGRSFDEDVRRVKLARRLLGQDRELMVDATTVYDMPMAKRMCRVLGEARVLWFEDPLPSDDYAGYNELTHTSDLAITAHYGARFPYPVIGHIKQRTVSQVQPAIDLAGGFIGSRRLLDLARFHHVAYVPSCWGTDLDIASTLHFLATIPSLSTRLRDSAPMLEYDTSENPLREAVLKEPFRLQANGTVIVPDKPGLGVEVNTSALDRYITEKV